MRGVVASLLIARTLSENVVQYQAVTPETGIVSWKKVTFPANYTATSLSEVTIEDVNETIEELGAWQDLNVEGTPLLTIRTHDDDLFVQLNTYVAPLGPNTDFYYQGGCCVDSFRKFNKYGNGSYTSYDVMNTMFNLFANTTDTDKNTGTPFAYANHIFDMIEIDGDAVALLAATYHEPALDYAEVEAVVMYNTVTSQPMTTKDGQSFFSFFQNVGTLSTDPSDSIYKIMYTVDGGEQFHMNGLLRFQSNDGTYVLATTYRANAECVLLKCPFTYSKADGGGSILQRFGTPAGHRFGYSVDDAEITSMHNMYHTVYPDTNKETISLFVNSQVGYSNSRVFEFEVKLTPEPTTAYDDTVFDTDYISGTTSVFTTVWGGVRPVGQGVWLVGFDQITLADQTSNPEEFPDLSVEDIEALKPERDMFKYHYSPQRLAKRDKQARAAHSKKATNYNRQLLQGPPPGDDDNVPPPPGDDDNVPPPPDDDNVPPPPDDNFDDSKHPSDDDDNDLNIPFDDDGLTIYDTYDAFTFITV